MPTWRILPLAASLRSPLNHLYTSEFQVYPIIIRLFYLNVLTGLLVPSESGSIFDIMSYVQSKNISLPHSSPPGIALKPHPGPSKPITARIQASASGLVRQSIVKPCASSVTNNLASSAADAGKGGSGSSSAGPSQPALSSMSSNTERSSVSNALTSPRELSERPTFRTRRLYEENDRLVDQFGFDEFMSRTQSAQTPQWLNRGDSVEASKEGQVLRSHSSKANIQSIPALQKNSPDYHEPKVTKCSENSSDGAAVVTLLSDPDFSADDDPADASILEMQDHDRFQAGDLALHAQAAPPRNQVSAINPLDLLPDFRRPKDNANMTGPACLIATKPTLPETYTNVICQLQSHDGDLQPWLDMLYRYQDEVWGDMLPLVEEARKEAKAATSSIPQDQPATRRLRMLLRHLI